MKERCIKDSLSFNRLIFDRASGNWRGRRTAVNGTPEAMDAAATELLLGCYLLVL